MMHIHPAVQHGTRNPLRILFVVDSLDIGGAEIHAVRLATALVRRGHQVTLACSKSGPLAIPAVHAGVSVRPLLGQLVKRQFSLLYAKRLGQLLRKEKFDLVHAHIYASVSASACAALGTNIPFVISEQSQAHWRKWFACLLSRWFYSRAVRIIAVSQEIQSRLIVQDKVPADRISIMRNTLPPECDYHPDIGRLRSTLNGSSGKTLVGIVARLQPEKGVAIFLEAASHISLVAPDVHFVVVGDGPLRQELQNYAATLKLRDRVHFVGALADAHSFLGCLDILVIASLNGEGTPLVSLEAMLAGVPIVATKVGGIPEQMRDSCEAVLVPPGDSLATSGAVLRLLQDPSLAARLAKAGRERALSQFRFEPMLDELENLYHSAVNQAHSF